MLTFPTKYMVTVGEAMVETSPVGDGMHRRGYAGDTLISAWHILHRFGEGAVPGFVTRIGSGRPSEVVAVEMSASNGLALNRVTLQ